MLKPILILEDDPSAQARIHSILKTFGYLDDDLFFSQTIEKAKQIHEQNTIGLFWVDLNLPDGCGIEFIQSLRQRHEQNVPVMVLSAWNSIETIYKALTVGARGYVLKERDDVEVMFAIRTMLKGEAIIDPGIAKEILKKLHLMQRRAEVSADANLQANLSSRELEILNFIANGFSSREISEKIHISRFTVDVHIKKVYQKLQVNSRTKAVHLAKQIGLLS
ncbi:LuxR C-terminal-related transcriptional regulator [Acinetobacter sp.]|uniref:LuxR C-terminal-related transcriptional regulator n=1 Tax=Acinetobacter sp. TaxID=472 RepID=UPI0035B23328